MTPMKEITTRNVDVTEMYVRSEVDIASRLGPTLLPQTRCSLAIGICSGLLRIAVGRRSVGQ